MNDPMLLDAVRTTLILLLKIVLPILAAGLVVGLIISIFQSLTQIQDQTLAFVPKLIVMVGAVIVLTPWIVAKLVDFTKDMILMK
jgi:flagellar biosynthesis protein FliQ